MSHDKWSSVATGGIVVTACLFVGLGWMGRGQAMGVGLVGADLGQVRAATAPPRLLIDDSKGAGGVATSAEDLRAALQNAAARLREASKLADQMAQMRERLNASRGENDRLVAALAEAQIKLKTLESNNQEAKGQIGDLTEAVAQSKSSVAELRTELATSQKQIEGAAQARREVESGIGQMQQALGRANDKVARLEQELGITHQQLMGAHAELSSVKEDRNIVRAELEDIRSQIITLLGEDAVGGPSLGVDFEESKGPETQAAPAIELPGAKSDRKGEGIAFATDEAEIEQAIDADYEAVRLVDIRAEPDPRSKQIGIAQAGATLRVSAKLADRNWYRIETQDGRTGYVYGDLIRAKTVDAASITRTIRGESSSTSVIKPAAAAVTKNLGDVLQECDSCPALVALPSGRFQMGSNHGDATEGPVREIAIERSFALGKYEVTVAEWQACVHAGGCDVEPEMYGVNDRSPVHNVSWRDAQRYLSWLSDLTGERYRLPSEAEWEYAARAGTTTRYWWGDQPGDANANCTDCGGAWDKMVPAETGLYPSNPFGLHDMNGGVMEWVDDCWAADHEGAPANGVSRATDGSCVQRVLRGGSWRNNHGYASSTSRLGYDADDRYLVNGFRVARDLN